MSRRRSIEAFAIRHEGDGLCYAERIGGVACCVHGPQTDYRVVADPAGGMSALRRQHGRELVSEAQAARTDVMAMTGRYRRGRSERALWRAWRRRMRRKTRTWAAQEQAHAPPDVREAPSVGPKRLQCGHCYRVVRRQDCEAVQGHLACPECGELNKVTKEQGDGN